MKHFIDLGGWIHLPHEIERIQSMQPHPTMKIARGMYGLQAKRETTLLYMNVVKILGKFNVRLQTTGDCTSMGTATCVDCLKATQIVLNGGEWKNETATEPIYAYSRVEIGKGQLSGQAGSSGAWAAEAAKFGTLIRGVYGKYDLSVYSGKRADEWGETGVPDELEPILHEHPVKAITQINSVEDVISAITNGYPVSIACNTGFKNIRDKNGFSWPEGNWSHEQCILGYRTDIEGFCVVNSWGPDWITGPTALDQVPGSYWITGEVLNDIFSRGEMDAWSYSNYVGFEPQEMDMSIV